jgi:tryptophan-rich sensory protein
MCSKIRFVVMKPIYWKTTLCAILCLTLGIMSGLSTADSIRTWYVTIQKPSWNPPNWLFGPVWTVLYLSMGIALGLVWDEVHTLQKKAMMLFLIQFIFNLAWSSIFFGFHQIGWAFAEILSLLAIISFTIYYFYRIKPIAGILLIPYLIWVSFASILNGTIWYLNL